MQLVALAAMALLVCLCAKAAQSFKVAHSLRPARVARLSSTVDPLQEPSGLPTISWYPGHIAKAERELAEYLKKVDIVIEVRDARIPLATTHPMVPRWVANKPLIVAVGRLDQVSPQALLDWREYYARNAAHAERPDAKVFFVDGKNGAGVLTLKKHALKAGEAVNQRRVKRGIEPRAVRAAIIGFPNVGKSALINRLLGRKMARSRNLPGVTRSLQWIRVGGLEGSSADTLELLDSPGIIPARQFDQKSALHLAICNDIGEASYDRVVVAAAMCEELIRLHRSNPAYVNMKQIVERYNLPFDELSGEDIVQRYADRVYKGNAISSADKLLGDFRKGMMGFGSLQSPKKAPLLPRTPQKSDNDSSKASSSSSEHTRDNAFNVNILDIGRGNYEGW